ncbi:MAG: hypothetical protein AVDCRST_MAG93-9261 [uncultured Chloroflexia bacterium]|uniref:Uncharacterized protein n=1 Tax=uncultured Chloroflexia bacterium TaxID=1672391 RepID=A0A6J4NDS0_9CHLR|nr:MAG: hypothetical protein AVDCRST_MAG93-9261 [uncultured Chloroflexia bacterium]
MLVGQPEEPVYPHSSLPDGNSCSSDKPMAVRSGNPCQ